MREFTEQELVRRGKLEEIAKVCNPYPEKYEKTHSLQEAKNLQDGTVDVFLPSDPNSIFTRIQNQSIYQDLQIGDGVELLLKNGRFSNCWIIAKHSQ